MPVYIPEAIIQKRTGHESTSALRQYEWVTTIYLESADCKHSSSEIWTSCIYASWRVWQFLCWKKSNNWVTKKKKKKKKKSNVCWAIILCKYNVMYFQLLSISWKTMVKLYWDNCELAALCSKYHSNNTKYLKSDYLPKSICNWVLDAWHHPLKIISLLNSFSLSSEIMIGIFQ